MVTQPEVEESNIPTPDSNQEAHTEAVSWSTKIAEQYGMLKTHAQTYPFVWSSYIIVYGVVGSWMVYRWTKLRRTEAEVQALQERVRKMYEAKQRQIKNSTTDAHKSARSASSSTNKPPPSADGV